jgi:hypothetical protein
VLRCENTLTLIFVGSVEAKAWSVITSSRQRLVKEAVLCGPFYFSYEGSISVNLKQTDYCTYPIISNKGSQFRGQDSETVE